LDSKSATINQGDNVSISFKVKTHLSAIDKEPVIAFCFNVSGPRPGTEVRFAFPGALLYHLRDVQLIGSDNSLRTIGGLFDEAVYVDFLKPEQAADTFLNWGSDVRENGKRAKAFTENV
jgi:hypothetical protein